MPEPIEGYAAAILEIARAEGVLESVESELYTIARTVEASTELSDTLSDPRVPADRKRAIIEDLLAAQASPISVAFTKFVVGLGRAKELPAMVDRLVERAAVERNKAVAEVRSAVPLDGDQIARLEDSLGRATGKNVEVKLVVDPSVLGGLVARIGDIVIDGSVRHRLDGLREALWSR